MNRYHYLFFSSLVGVAVLVTALYIRGRFTKDLVIATERASRGSEVIATGCGPIEVQQAGDGVPLLMIHGSGGGHDQGMAWAKPLVQQGIHVIAMSRFGYLRTPMPKDGSPEAQADAHICLLDALGIERATVVGISAGSPSALQTAIRHPERVSALVLVVPIVNKPGEVSDSAPVVSDSKDAWLLRVLGSDFLFWTGLKLMPTQIIRHVLATPPELVASASAEEKARVSDLMNRILPVSIRAAGLLADTGLGKRLRPYDLQSIQAPTLVVSARDDAFGTYAGAQYTANQIPEAKFIGYDQGGHLLVGHDRVVQTAVIELVTGAQ